MNSSAKPTIDMTKPHYQRILDAAQSQSPGLLGSALLNIDSGDHLHSTASSTASSEELSHWIDVAKALFANQCEPFLVTDFSSLKNTKQAYLEFDDQSLACVAIGQSPSPSLVILRDKAPLGMELSRAKELSDQHPQRFDALAKNPHYLDRDGVHSISDLTGSGSAEQLCRVPYAAQELISGLFGEAALPSLATLQMRHKLHLDRLLNAYIDNDRIKVIFQRPRYLADHIIILVSNDHNSPAELAVNVRKCADNVLRQLIDDTLEQGINTDVSLAEDDQTWQSIVQELRELDRDDLLGVLEVGGFANHSLGDEGEMEAGAVVLRCAECIYYYPNRKWCDLPELPVPVEPHWYCKLWKL